MSLNGANTVNPTFTAPDVSDVATLIFRLTVDAGGGNVASDTVTVTVSGRRRVELGGILSTDTTLVSDTLYVVTNNLLVPSGVRLTIQPGTEIRFEGTFLQVDGELRAEGTAQNRITFRGGNTTVAWSGIRFSDSSVDYNPATGTGSIISHATIQDAYSYGQSAITAYNACPRLTNNDISRFAYYGINMSCSQGEIRDNVIHGDATIRGVWALYVSGQVTVDGNEIYGVGYSQNIVVTIQNGVTFTHNSIHDNIGVWTFSVGRDTVVEYNTIYNNGETGLVVGSSWGNDTGTITIRYNTIYGHYRNFEVRSLGNLTLNFSYNNLLGTPTWHVTNETSNVSLPNNYWGTTDASAIALKISDNDDDFRLGRVNYSPILASQYTAPVLGPANPSVSVTGYSGTTTDPIVNLALSATSATQMLISDNHTFPAQFQWEPFATTKDFHSDGTKYIYAKFKDASGNESAIAFAKPPRIMYIQKGSTLAGCPVLAQVRVASDLGGGQGGGGSPINTSQARVAANSRRVKTFYRPIGGSDYTELTMTPAQGIYSAWIPGSQTLNGIEYYFQVEDASGNVLATLPETNPSTQPFSLSATTLLQEDVTAGRDNAVEFAVGLTVQIPAGALASNTQLQVASPAATPDPPPGMTATDINYALSMADGTTTFSQPMTLTFGYADSDVAGMDATDLRAYYLDNGTVKLAGGTVNTTAHTVAFETTHFTDFFLAEGSLMYPAPVTTGTEGVPITIQASVVNYVAVQSATLYYRVGPSGTWKSLTMSQVGDYYQATIPGGDVTEAGLAYYIQASDGSTTATFPAQDPVNNPQTINVTLLLPLQTGWNLISIPRDQADTAITTVLSSISGSYDLVYAYDASDPTNPWRKYNVNAPPYSNNLSQINETMGVWVHMTTEGTLTVAGSIPPTTSIQLYQGWNLVGYPGIQAKAISEALSSIADKYTLIYAYDASNPADPWKKYNVGAPAWANNLSEVRSRLGYWILATENCVLTINN